MTKTQRDILNTIANWGADTVTELQARKAKAAVQLSQKGLVKITKIGEDSCYTVYEITSAK